MWIPTFLKAFELHNLDKAYQTDKVLVIVQLSGGNDGLNTVVPFRNDIYYQKRPRLAVSKEQVLKITDDLGFNPVLDGLRRLYEDGALTILNNVGYPNPDRSHFRSMDIWHTASESSEYLSTGWLGRYLDSTCSQDCHAAHEVIEIDDTLSPALKGEKIKGLAIKDAHKTAQATQTPHVQGLAKMVNEHDDHDNVSYLYKTLAETVSSAEYLSNKIKNTQNTAQYNMNPFAQQLKTIAQMVNAGLSTNVYYTSLTGFDTHVNQKMQQERLLKIYGDAMKTFAEDLKKGGRWKDTVVMTFSEFGRRVEQNASGGTDHGKASNVFIAGGNLPKAGVFNEQPNLKDLDEGDVKFSIDFRQIYATLLKKHLGADDRQILGKEFKTLSFV
jgi:uncharacterized protein (DUF1501 family)